MDSCNSGSLQSSSGNDDDHSYDSRATASLPSFSPNPPLLFDTYFLNTTIPFPEPTFQLSDPNPTLNISFNDPPPPPAASRNPKKRPRASRRAPTTVLTTDTSNFRFMVQEFTGLPSPPFRTTKLDIFAGSPPYLRRPLPRRPVPATLLNRNASSVTSTINSANGTTPISSGLNPFDMNQFQSGLKFPFSGFSSDVMGSNGFGVGSNPVHDGAGEQGVHNGTVESWICANSD